MLTALMPPVNNKVMDRLADHGTSLFHVLLVDSAGGFVKLLTFKLYFWSVVFYFSFLLKVVTAYEYYYDFNMQLSNIRNY